MYISIKLPASFGAFNRIRKENYPFNNLFTSYLAAVSRLGLAMQVDVDELVGYIEDSLFEGKRLPDIPEGNEPVNVRYRTEDPDVETYIKGSVHTNREAVMYIVRMTLRLSEAYGTSLLRLTRLISGLSEPVPAQKPERKRRVQVKAEPAVKKEQDVGEKTEPTSEAMESAPAPMPRISGRSVVQPAVDPTPKTVAESAQAARQAVNALASLAGGQEEDESGAPIVQTNPLLDSFMQS